MQTHLHSQALAAPRFRYTPCVRSGPFYTVSSMIGLEPSTGVLVAGGVAAETRQILCNLQAALPDYGLRFSDMSSARLYVVPFHSFAEVNAVWDEFFTATAPPARTSVGVSALPLGALIEMEFAFYRAS